MEATFNVTEAAAATANAPKDPKDMDEGELRTALLEARQEITTLKQHVAALETDIRKVMRSCAHSVCFGP